MPLLDLHTHSTASDGTDKPAELVQKAFSEGVAALALTDHDTIQGLEEAGEAAADLGIEFIRGCEISTRADCGEIHILGLWLPPKCAEVENFLAYLRQKRFDRNILIIDKLRSFGFDVSIEEAQSMAEGTVGRPHIAKLLLSKGYVKNWDEAFTTYLGKGGNAYYPKIVPQPEEAIKLLVRSGATVSFAHPMAYEHTKKYLPELINQFKKAGLTAVEAWHSSHTEGQTREIINHANQFDLGLSGGSDYHGSNRKARKLGYCQEGKKLIPFEILENLKSRRKKQGLPC